MSNGFPVFKWNFRLDCNGEIVEQQEITITYEQAKQIFALIRQYQKMVMFSKPGKQPAVVGNKPVSLASELVSTPAHAVHSVSSVQVGVVIPLIKSKPKKTKSADDSWLEDLEAFK